MEDETFDKLHQQTGGVLTTGPSQEAIVGAEAGAASASEDGGSSVGGAAPSSPVPLPRLSSFSVYYDQADKTLKIFEPQVFGPNGTIICGLPENIANGTYYCNVLKQKTSGTYIAKIEETAANADSGYEKVCSVKLFTLNGMDFKQFHAGAIFVPGGGGGQNYVAGDDTNIVFAAKKDSEGNATGEIAVDVYYK